jgi:hypothetical protein
MAQPPRPRLDPGSSAPSAAPAAVPPPQPPAAARAIEARYRQATQEAAAAAAEVVRISDATATALLRQPPARRLEALDNVDLEPADRRRLRESVGVSLVPERRASPASGRRGLVDRLRVAFARWRPNPVAAVIALLAAAPIVVGVGLAWAHTGRGIRASGACPDIAFTRPDGGELRAPLGRGDLVVVRGYDGPSIDIARWAPRTGYVTALVDPRCLIDQR